MVFEKKVSKNTLHVALQTMKLSDLDKSQMKRGGLLNKHSCETKIKYLE